MTTFPYGRLRTSAGRCLVLGVLLGLALLVWFVRPAAAEPVEPVPQVQSPTRGFAQAQGPDNDFCLSCHSRPGQTMELHSPTGREAQSGEELFITVDPEVYDTSVHGLADVACVQCHTDITEYPHPPVPVTTQRQYVLDQSRACATCHEDEYLLTLDSVHHEELMVGNTLAAVCTDCHSAHAVQPPTEPLSRAAATCEKCHSEIYDTYANSVHGSALIGEGNPDVPSCTDCHGAHAIKGPSEPPFHLFSPQICADCHADPALMSRYDISTDVFDTYVSDFHGTTVQLFQNIAPGQETNKPVCVDCHGVHNILPPEDPHSTVMKANLLDTCQRCHPNATTNFPDSWLGHYVPSAERNPLVYYVNLFYLIFIPTVLGAMVLFNLTDIGRFFARFLKERRNDPRA